MVAIPKFVNELRVPGADLPRVDPAAIAAPAVAFTRGVEQVSDEMRKFAEKREQAKQQADAAKINVQGTQYLDTAEQEASKFDDQDAAYAAWDRSVKEGRAQFIDPIADPEVKAHAGQIFDMQAITRRNAVGRASFANESSRRVADLDMGTRQFQQSIAATDDPMLKELLTDAATADIRGAVASGHMHAEEGAKRELAFLSGVDEVQAKQLLNGTGGDPDATDKIVEMLNDPNNWTHLQPETRERLVAQAQAKSYQQTVRAAARQSREDAESARALRLTQQETETQLFVDIHNGKIPSPEQIEILASTHQISEAGLRGIYSVIDRKGGGTDDHEFTAHLWERVGDGSASFEEVYAGGRQGLLSKNTETEMVKALTVRGRQERNAVEAGFKGQLRTALTGASGDLDLTGALRANVAQLWSQAQGEWTTRVVLGGGDPYKVLEDMLPRYMRAKNGTQPLPPPRFGSALNETQLNATALRTKQALDSGQIDEATYNAEVDVLNQYRRTMPAPGAMLMRPPPIKLEGAK